MSVFVKLLYINLVDMFVVILMLNFFWIVGWLIMFVSLEFFVLIVLLMRLRDIRNLCFGKEEFDRIFKGVW